MRTRHGERVGTVYEILVRGGIGEALAEELGATKLMRQRGGTVIVVEIIDQAHLHGVLERLRDLNIDIESVNPAGG